MKKIRAIAFFGGLLAALLLSGCSMEMKLAKKYMAERPQIAAAVYFPEQAEVKVEFNTHYGRQTEVLKGFSQDLFLDVVYNAYAETMGQYGVEVYVPEDIENVQVDSVHWLVMLSRMEISGRITEYEDYLFSDLDEFSYKHPLNTVNVASWFEISDGEWKPVRMAYLTSDDTGNKGKRLDFMGGAEGNRFFLMNGGYFDRPEKITRELMVENIDTIPPSIDLNQFVKK